MDIADLLPKIIQAMQTNQQVRPTVYAELTPGTVLTFPLFNFTGEARQKAHLLFTTGRDAGQKQSERELVETVFVSEIWLTQGQRNPNPGRKPPPNVPQKEAVMLAVAKNAAPYETLVIIYEVRRKGGKAKELIHLSEDVDKEALMGLAFIAGWKSRGMSDEEVRQLQPRGMRAFLEL